MKSSTSSTLVQTLDPFPKQILSIPNTTNDYMSGSSRDRTNEFRNTVKTFANKQKGNVQPATNNHRRNPTSAIEQRSIFMRSAKIIGENLSRTFYRLDQLTTIAKQSSLFNDRTAEIQALTVEIKEDISSLNGQIAELQQHMQHASNSKSKNSQTHSNSVVFVLQSKLANMSNDFKHVLETRTQHLKDQKLRRDNFSKNTVATCLTAPPVVSNTRPSILLRDDYQATNGRDAIINMNTDEALQKQQLLAIDESDNYYASRSETMQNIEQTIVELGDIFTQLATIINQQGESVDLINRNVDEANVHIEAAHGELLKYFRSVTSNRWLMIKVFAILIVFFLIFIIFMV